VKGLLYLFCASLIALSAAGCGGDSKSSTPTAPTPAVLVLTATGDWPAASRPDSPTVTGNGNALGVANVPAGFGGTDGKDAGAVWVAIKATASNLGQVRGDLTWDPALLSFDAYGRGEWFENGANVSWTLLTSTAGRVSFLLDRPSTVSGATGTGSVVYLRLRGRAAGTSLLQWSNPELRGPDFSSRPLTGGSYGGSVSIR
jgi:hypothetical protein